MEGQQRGTMTIEEMAKVKVMTELKVTISPKGVIFIELPKNAFMEHESSLEKIVYRLIK